MKTNSIKKEQNYLLQILDFPNNTTYRLFKKPNGFEWFKIDKFILPIADRFAGTTFDLMYKKFGQNTLGFNYT